MLEYKPIDLEKHADLCIEFAKEMHDLSFPPGTPFDSVGHLDKIREKLAADPMSCVHVWLAGEIVGQINFGIFAPDPSIGYINIFYVIPKWRGKGVAGEMERYGCARLESAGFNEAWLSVGWVNTRAVRFYQKHGWADLGERPDRPGIHNMRKIL